MLFAHDRHLASADCMSRVVRESLFETYSGIVVSHPPCVVLIQCSPARLLADVASCFRVKAKVGLHVLLGGGCSGCIRLIFGLFGCSESLSHGVFGLALATGKPGLLELDKVIYSVLGFFTERT